MRPLCAQRLLPLTLCFFPASAGSLIAKSIYAAPLSVLLANCGGFFPKRKKPQRLIEVSEVKKMKNIASLAKKDKISTLLAYARDCYKKGHKPTKRSVRKRFHVEIYNYFKNIGEYHRKAGFEVAVRFLPKETARSMIADYIKKEVRANRYPEFREIERKFKIKFVTYFDTIEQLYKCANIDFSLVKKARELSRFSSKEVIAGQKDAIKDFIRKNVAKGIYPSVPFIQKTLNLSFYNLYYDIFQAYKEANAKYDRPSPILLGKKKEEVLTGIIKKLLVKMDFKIKRVSIESDIGFNRRADMTVEDNDGKTYVVEIKAFREDYSVSKRELLQLTTYIKQESVSFGIFVTTSASIKCNYKNILFINGNFLVKLLEKHGLGKYRSKIEWIQSSRVNSVERKEYIRTRKMEIFDYIKMKGGMPTKRDIEKTLRIDIRSVFGRPRPYEKLLDEARIKCLPYTSLNS